jgi:APA family basic amino acid/polyamine antiporter
MGLKRTMSFFDAYSIGVGAIIGAGIFVVLGIATREAGPALIFSLIISATVSSFTALSFAELVHKIPKDGGGYEFAHEMISPYAGFLTGWMWLISNLLSGAAVAIGFAQYLAIVVPLPANILAALACVAITGLNYWGAKESSLVNDGLVIFKIIVLMIFVAFGLLFVKVQNFSPFAPQGPEGIMAGSALIFFAFSGFGRVAMVSEEIRDPEKNVPRALLAALASAMVIYLLVSIVAIGLVGPVELGSSNSPLVEAGSAISPAIAQLLGVAALAATLSVLLTALLGISRITFAMSRNGDMPRALVRIHPTRGTPFIAIIVFGTIMTSMALITDLLFAAAVSNFASLVYYAMVNLSASKMEKPMYSHAFPILGMASCLLLLPFLGTYALALGLTFTLIITILFLVRRSS